MPRRESELAQDVKSKTETVEPNLDNDRIDTEEPNARYPSMLMLLETLVIPKIDIAEFCRVKHRIDMELPKCDMCNTDTALDRRAVLRIERVEPSDIISYMLK
jgi:hypothetical protein